MPIMTKSQGIVSKKLWWENHGKKVGISGDKGRIEII